jgi:hypothetical protein
MFIYRILFIFSISLVKPEDLFFRVMPIEAVGGSWPIVPKRDAAPPGLRIRSADRTRGTSG